MEARGEVSDITDSDEVPRAAAGAGAAAAPGAGALPVPMQEDDVPASARQQPGRDGVNGSEFSDPAAMLDSLDPLAAHMDALRRQLGGNFRDLTNHSDDPSLERYVEGEEDEGSGGAGGEQREDPREFYARVMAHQRMVEETADGGADTGAGEAARAHLLSSVPPVTTEQAAMLAAQYEQEHSAARSVPDPDDESFEAAPLKPDQPVWVRETPDRTPVRDEAESDDEDVALLKQMAALSVERSPATDALKQAESDLAEATDSVARGDSMQAERIAEDGSVQEEDDISRFGSVLDSEIAGIAGTMLAADEILSTERPQVQQVGNEDEDDDIDDPVATLLSIAAEAAAELEQPNFDSGTLEDKAKELTSMGVPPSSMGGGAGLVDLNLGPVEGGSSSTAAAAAAVAAAAAAAAAAGAPGAAGVMGPMTTIPLPTSKLMMPDSDAMHVG